MHPPWLVLCLSGVEPVSGEWGQRSGLTVFLYQTLRGDALRESRQGRRQTNLPSDPGSFFLTLILGKSHNFSKPRAPIWKRRKTMPPSEEHCEG